MSIGDDGNVLIIGTKSYNVRSASTFPYEQNSKSFTRQCNVTATLKSKASIVGGKRGSLVTVGDVLLTPLFPASREVLLQEETSGSVDLYECYSEGDGEFYHLVLEDIKEVNG